MYPFVDGVELVAWPADAAAVADLRDHGTPRLLLVAADAEPPRVDDELEDWVRLPASPRDVEVRARRLVELASTQLARPDRGGVRA